VVQEDEALVGDDIVGGDEAVEGTCSGNSELHQARCDADPGRD
jgi:hypothetical protein